jgi:ABC-2 type transport system permease protein
MGWRTVARADLAQLAGSRSVKLLLALPALAILAAGYVYPLLGTEPYTTARFAGYATGWFVGIVSLVGVLLGYNTVVSERESGAILLSLSLPQGRGTVVAGRVISRVGLLAGIILAALLVAGGLVVYPFGSLELLPYLGFVLLSVVFAWTWTCLGIAASLSVATKQRALVVAGGLFFLFEIVWDGIVATLDPVLRRAGLLGTGTADILRFVFSIDPGSVFNRVVAGFIDPSGTLGGPWYLGEWMALVLFAFWAVVPLGLAYRRFAGRDLA